MRRYMAGRGSGRMELVLRQVLMISWILIGILDKCTNFNSGVSLPKGIVNEDPSVFGGELRVSLHGILMGQLLIS